MTAGGNYILTQDITITKPHSGDFQGHFDGNGHTITLSDNMTSGPFGIVNGPSTIENLKVAGSATGTELHCRYCRYGQYRQSVRSKSSTA